MYLTILAAIPQADNFLESSLTALPDPQHVDAEPSRQERLMREAEGLFAGVTLLNEIEPLKDIDELNVGESQDSVDWVALEVIRRAPYG